MSLGEVLARDRRRMMLACLKEDPGYALNERSLRMMLEHIGHNLSSDQLRDEALYLETHLLARVEKLPTSIGELWLLHLTEKGLDVANGTPHPGVARPAPR
ncbi:VpaChn25_0724 family phage protein [Acidisoma sp. 7E03]